MPPILPRKRIRSPSPPKSAQRRAIPATREARPTIFDTYDEQTALSSTAETKAFVDALSSSESELSDVDSDEFEDVVLPTPKTKRQKIETTKAQIEVEEESDDDLEFEDVHVSSEDEDNLRIPEIAGEFNVTVQASELTDYSRLKKTVATRAAREARIASHSMHVQFLLWHNTIRNMWINDKEVQGLLMEGLSDGIKDEVKKWKISMGYETSGKKSKGKAKAKDKSGRERGRDWGAQAQRLEPGAPNLSQGDPLIRLLKYLTAYWKKRFRLTAPSLRKIGYCDIRRMRHEMDSWNDGPHDPERHGERIASLEEFREAAKKCQGSSDVGAQLFTALLRGLGIGSRMVASIQPMGFGWSKVEEANPRKTAKSEDGLEGSSEPAHKTSNGKAKNKAKTGGKPVSKIKKSMPVISKSPDNETSSSLSSDSEASRHTSLAKSPAKRHDKDLLYPTYWTEVLSPVSNTYVPVSIQVNPNVTTTVENLINFEPRGAAAEKAKQVICYVIAFSSDGTAKDVTVRYLRKKVWPGKTKGFRIPIEKIPVYNKNGKVMRYEDYDWFKRVMRGYARRGDKVTLADDIEDEGDLIPIYPEKDEKNEDAMPDTLQGLKQSAKYVLERHFRREEALLPGAKSVQDFSVGKGDKATKEAVYLRKDVVLCKTAESWHKEGLAIIIGERSLKQVPSRAVTLIRKRENESQLKETGAKPTQGLYARHQTEWIVPDPIGEDGKIPKNIFGNMDVYVPSMVPKGAVHIPLRGTARVCKKLGIEFAEACTGFEFGKQRAVPVLTGVVIAEANEDMVIDAWEEDERVRRAKEDKKREAAVLGAWKRFYRGLKIRKRLGEEYGFDDEHEDGQWASKGEGHFGMERPDVNNAGGFLREGGEGEAQAGPGGFFLDSEDEQLQGAEIEIVGGSQGQKAILRGHADRGAFATPTSLQAMHAAVDEDPGDPGLAAHRLYSHDDEEMFQHDIAPKAAGQRKAGSGGAARSVNKRKLQKSAVEEGEKKKAARKYTRNGGVTSSLYFAE